MRNLEIYIDGERLNFVNRDGFPLALTYSIESAENPGQLNGAHSKRTANFPGDGVTDQFFEEWANAARINPDAANQKPARVEVNGVTVLSGVAQLDEVAAAGIRHGRAGAEHKVALFGNNATWFADLQDKLVKDMGMIPDHDFTLTKVIGSGEGNNNPDPDTHTWGYFLVRTSDWQIFWNTRWSDHQPFLFVRPLLQEAFRQVGYQFNSDFFDTDFGKRLMMPALFRPYPDNVLQGFTILVMDQNNATSVNISTHTHITLAGDKFLSDPGGHYNLTTGYYTVPMSGYYICGVQESDLNYSHRIRINTVVQAAFADPCEIGIGEQGRVYMEEGDEVDLAILSNQPTAGFCFLYIRPDFGPFDEGTGVRFSLYGNPTWRVSDVVLGLTHAFGLVWDTDYDAQTVRAEPRDRYKTSQQPADEDYHEGFYRIAERDDLTQRVDLSKDAAMTALNSEKERYVLAWKQDGNDGNAEQMDGEAEMKIFDGKYTFPTGRFQRGESRSENPFFCKTVHIMDNYVMHVTSTKTPQIPLILKNPFLESNPYGEERGDFGPRLLWFAGRREGVDGLVNLEDYLAYDFPAAFMVNYNDTTGLDPSLSFGDEILLDGTTEAPGLMQRFHLQRLKRMEVGKLLSEWIRWSELDILKLDFRRKILIGDALYLLQKINGYRPLIGGSTETELLKDEIPEDADLLKITESELAGYIISPLPEGE